MCQSKAELMETILQKHEGFTRTIRDEDVESTVHPHVETLNVDSLVIGYQEPREPEPEPFEDEVLDEEEDTAMGNFQ